jgi:hypothetical protein
MESRRTRLLREWLEVLRGIENEGGGESVTARPPDAEMMEKLQTCSIRRHLWWYSSKLSDTLCMLLTALVIWSPASSRAEELAK